MNYTDVLAALGWPSPEPSVEELIDAGVVVKGRNFRQDRHLHLIDGNPHVITGPLTACAQGGVIRLFVSGIRGPQPFGRARANQQLIAQINALNFEGALMQSPEPLDTPHYILTVRHGRRTELAALLGGS